MAHHWIAYAALATYFLLHGYEVDAQTSDACVTLKIETQCLGPLALLLRPDLNLLVPAEQQELREYMEELFLENKNPDFDANCKLVSNEAFEKAVDCLKNDAKPTCDDSAAATRLADLAVWNEYNNVVKYFQAVCREYHDCSNNINEQMTGAHQCQVKLVETDLQNQFPSANTPAMCPYATKYQECVIDAVKTCPRLEILWYPKGGHSRTLASDAEGTALQEKIGNFLESCDVRYTNSGMQLSSTSFLIVVTSSVYLLLRYI